MAKNKIIINTLKLIALVLASVTLYTTAPDTASAAGNFLCSPSEGTDSQNDVPRCVNNIYRFSIIAASIGAVFLIVIAGYLYMFAGGDEHRVSTAKSLIISSLVGIAILLTGLLILRQINPNLLSFKNISPSQIDSQDWTYNPEGPTVGGPAGPLPPAPVGNTPELARQILARTDLTIVNNRSDGSGAKDQLAYAAAGKEAKLTSCNTTVQLSQTTLGKIIELANAMDFQVQINSIAGGIHANNTPACQGGRSYHYWGRAVDFDVTPNDTQKLNLMRDWCERNGAVEAFGPNKYPASSPHKTWVHCAW